MAANSGQKSQLLHFHQTPPPPPLPPTQAPPQVTQVGNANTIHPQQHHQMQQLMQAVSNQNNNNNNSQHHHYATLHHQQQQQQHIFAHQNQHFLQQHRPSSSQHSSHSSAGSQTMPFLQHQHNHHHHHRQQQQHTLLTNHLHQQQPPSYNGTNNQQNSTSDYSSSTYHVYDQILGDQIIDDLIVIKQERMKKKLEQEHKRKVILFACALIILVGLLFFLIVQLFKASSPSSTATSLATTSLASSSLASIASTNNNNNLARNNNIGADLGRPPNWAPSFGAHHKQSTSDFFDASKFQQQQQQVAQLTPTTKLLQPTVCSGHGQLQFVDGLAPSCRCELAYIGDQCQHLVRCTSFAPGQFCQNSAHCDRRSGRCQCPNGFFGPQCEFNLHSRQATNPFSSPTTTTTTNLQQQQDNICSSLLSNCNGRGRCLAHLEQCECFAGFAGDTCELRVGEPVVDQVLGNNQQLAAAAAVGNKQDVILTPQEAATAAAANKAAILAISKLSANCSFHGRFDALNNKCLCDFGFSGPQCASIATTSEINKSIDDTQQVQAASISPLEVDLPTSGSNSEQVQSDCDSSNNNKTQQQQQQQLDCGLFGSYSCAEKRCICQDGYTGELCRLARCSARCLRNGGLCLPDGQCSCPPGRFGRHCSFDGCPNNCSARGQCLRPAEAPQEWRCQCQPGLSGDDCSQLSERQCDDGLDNDQDGLVDCADSECCSDRACQNSTLCMKSPDPLDILMRKQPPASTASFFQRMQFLIEKFSSQTFSNVKDFNDNLYTLKNIDRVSVIRGRVSYQRQGVTGVRVSVAGQISLGITLSRDNGHFDLMVNGGGPVVLEFQREPFATLQRSVRVPWNEIVLLDNVELQLEQGQQKQQQQQQLASNQQDSSSATTTITTLNAHFGQHQQQQHQFEELQQQQVICSAHNYRLMKPQIIATGSWRRARNQQAHHHHHNHHHPKQQVMTSNKLTTSASNKLQRAVILRDSALVQQTIILPESSASASSLLMPTLTTQQQQASTNNNNKQHQDEQQQQQQQVSLVYSSSKANEFMATLNIQLTPQAGKLSDELKLIHLRIIIEGNLFEQRFEAQSNLSFTWAWNRRNVYKQKSFGLSMALVSIGYEYFDCKKIIWTSKQIPMAGHDLSISDIGNQWNLNIHHRYNYRDAILQRGDGQNFNLRAERPLVVQAQMGDGYQRAPMCPYCDGQSALPSEHRLLRPQALLVAPDNSLYVGDHNLIRRMEASPVSSSGERLVKTILELPLSAAKSLDNLARQQQQQLRYSLALSSGPEPRLYLADAERAQIFWIKERSQQQQQDQQQLFMASNDSTGSDSLEASLVPVVGTGARCATSEPVRDNCGDSGQASAARLSEPRSIVFDLANRMYIADGPTVRLVEPETRRIFTLLGDHSGGRMAASSSGAAAAGHKFPCTPGETMPMHKFAPKAPQALALSPIDDTLHLLDENVVYKITQDKRIQLIAGRPAHCPPPASPTSTNKQQQQQQQRASEFNFQAAQWLAFKPNGQLLVGEDDSRLNLARVLLVDPEDDLIWPYAGAQTFSTSSQQPTEQQQVVAFDREQMEPSIKNRASNALPSSRLFERASEHRFASIGAIAVDQRGHLLVAERQQPRVVSVEPEVAQLNAAGEYELTSPDNGDELLVFNRFGHHVATRELVPLAGSASQQQPTTASSSSSAITASQTTQQSSSSSSSSQLRNKYTFSYNINTSFGQLSSVQFANGNKLSIFREGPHHSVKMIETTQGGQCKLDISRQGQVHSISISTGPQASRINLAYHIEGGLLRQSRDQASGEQYEFVYDEFGRAQTISLSSPRLAHSPLECSLQLSNGLTKNISTSPRRETATSILGQQQQQHQLACQALIVPDFS